MTPSVVIRRSASDDAAPTRAVFFAAVRVGAAERYTAQQLAAWVPTPEMPEGWGDWLDRNITFVAEDAGRITGFFMLEPSGYLNMAFVDPAERGSGLAGQLYAAILAEAHARRITTLTVWASRLARPFLARQGWVIDHDPPALEGHPVPTEDPDPIDYAMKLDLDPTQ